MKKQKTRQKYWVEQFDRFGLIFGGMFLGALMELTGIKTLGIIVSVAGMTCMGILIWWFKR